LLLQPKILPLQPNDDRTKQFVVVKNIFVIPILTNDFVGKTKPFFRDDTS